MDLRDLYWYLQERFAHLCPNCTTNPRNHTYVIENKEHLSGGEGGIRTHGTRKGSTVFETARFNRSRTSPFGRVFSFYPTRDSFSSAAGKLRKKVDPAPSFDSTQIRPPCAFTIRRHTARPIPDPGTSGPCSRLNGVKIFS